MQLKKREIVRLAAIDETLLPKKAPKVVTTKNRNKNVGEISVEATPAKTEPVSRYWQVMAGWSEKGNALPRALQLGAVAPPMPTVEDEDALLIVLEKLTR